MNMSEIRPEGFGHKRLFINAILHFIAGFFLLTGMSANAQNENADQYNPSVDPAEVFMNPPESAKPGVLWMWMGSNITREGIKKDLEALKREGFNRTTLFSLADVTTPWSAIIGNSPTPQIIAWTEPWWQLVRYAAEESLRLGMDFGMFNGPSYETSGGPWITPELSMQEICWSSKAVSGARQVSLHLEKPSVDPRAHMPFPVFNPETGLTENPVIQSRKTYYKDIAVLALPAEGIVKTSDVRDLTSKLNPDGTLQWDVPEGNWMIYRFGHTTMGALIQPAQPQATGLECDKMSREAVEFHMDHVIGEIQKHLGDLIGKAFTHVHFDSYEAGYPTWTPKMKEEFLSRRGYDLTPYLATFAGRLISSPEDSARFSHDFDATIKDLYRDIYFTTVSKKLQDAHLVFLCEPYGGPWRQEDVIPLVHHVMTEFWTNNGVYTPYELEPTVAALRQSGHNLIESEAFTGQPADSRWCEYPAWLKPIGDAAFCAGVNRMVLHRFVHQPWDDKYKPGNTMGQWGTHFDRTQTWWNPGTALVKYWQRCHALLLWGKIAMLPKDFVLSQVTDSINVKYIHRTNQATDIYFLANTSHHSGSAYCTFMVTGLQPELWDPVTGAMRKLPQYEGQEGKTTIQLRFEDAQSYFIVFRNKTKHLSLSGSVNFPSQKTVTDITAPWLVQFDTTWGGPSRPVLFPKLEDWTRRPEKGIRYFSGTAIYHTSFDLPESAMADKKVALYLDLGVVNHIARVFLNNKELGIVWTAPWRIEIPVGLLRKNNNDLQIEVTNVWANRMIGDEQEPPDCVWMPGQYFYDSGKYLKEFPDWFLKNKPRPSKGRYCFTTWNYFTRDSPLVPSGLMGPVRIVREK
jgi:hypothetical protein